MTQLPMPGGLFNDPMLKQYMQQQRQQQFWGTLMQVGQGLLSANRQGQPPLRALASGMAQGGRAGGQGMGGLLDWMKMQQYQQTQQRKDQRASKLSTAFGGLDPTTGIDWKTGRRGSIGYGNEGPVTPQPGANAGVGSALGDGRGARPTSGVYNPTQTRQQGLLGDDQILGLLSNEQRLKHEYGQRFGENKARKTAKDVAGHQRYLDTTERVFPGVEKPADPQYAGEPQLDPKVGKFYQTNPKTGKREYVGVQTGMNIEFPGGGSIQTGVPRGGAGAKGLTKSNRTYINKQIMAGEAALERLDAIKASWKPEWNTLEKRAELKWAALKEKAFGEELSPGIRAELIAFSEGSSNAISHVNNVIRDMTGAQMAAAEAKRLRLPEPDPGEGIWPHDSPTEFAAKLDARYKAIEKANARYRYYTQNGIYDVDQMAGKTPLDSMKVFVNPQTGERIVEIDDNWVPLQ